MIKLYVIFFGNYSEFIVCFVGFLVGEDIGEDGKLILLFLIII